IAASRLLVVGLGQKAKADAGSLVACAAAAAKSLTGKAYQTLAMDVPQPPPGVSLDDTLYAVGIGLQQGAEGAGLRKNKPDRFPPKSIHLIVPGNSSTEKAHQAARRAEVEGRAVSLARELVNLPPCDLFPESFADRARQVAQATGVRCEVFDEKRLGEERMG